MSRPFGEARPERDVVILNEDLVAALLQHGFNLARHGCDRAATAQQEIVPLVRGHTGQTILLSASASTAIADVSPTEVIQDQLGSAGQVIEQQIKDRLGAAGIDRGKAEELARAIEEETDAERLARARAEMDDEERARYERILKDQQELQKALENSRERVGVAADGLKRVVGAALVRAGTSLDRARAGTVGNVTTFTFDPADPAFTKETGWQDTFDDLRARPRKRGERINDWRKRVPIRAIAFESPRLPDGRDAPKVVQVHLEHRLVRRLLSRFLSQGFQSGLSRISVIEGPGAQAHVVLMGRLAVYGAGAARLHEEIIRVTAIWTEAERDRRPLRPLRESGEERTLNQLEEALHNGRAAPKMAGARVQAMVERDIADLLPTLERLSDDCLLVLWWRVCMWSTFCDGLWEMVFN